MSKQWEGTQFPALAQPHRPAYRLSWGEEYPRHELSSLPAHFICGGTFLDYVKGPGNFKSGPAFVAYCVEGLKYLCQQYLPGHPKSLPETYENIIANGLTINGTTYSLRDNSNESIPASDLETLLSTSNNTDPCANPLSEECEPLPPPGPGNYTEPCIPDNRTDGPIVCP